MKRKKKQVNVVWEFFYSGNKKNKALSTKKKLTETSTGDPCPNISALQLLFCSKMCFYD